MSKLQLILLTAIMVPCEAAFGSLTLDFSTASWAPGDPTETVTATDGVGPLDDVDVMFAFTGGDTVPQIAGALDAGTDTPYVASGVSGFSEGLTYRMDPPVGGGLNVPQADPSSGVTSPPVVLNITFEVPVFDLEFAIGDVDLGTPEVQQTSGVLTVPQYQDLVKVTGGAYTATFPHSFLMETAAGFLSRPYIDVNNNGSFDDGIDTVNTIGDVDDTSSSSNVELAFPGPISALTITYDVGPDSPTAIFTQWISIGNMSFTTVPEPSSFLFLGLVATCGVGFRRYCSKKAAV